MSDGKKPNRRVTGQVAWGPVLFYSTLVTVMVFFWWLLIYSHGVTSH